MKAFTLIELIFVIIIASLLSVLAIRSIPDNTLILDYEMLKQKILQKKSNAMGFYYTGDSNNTCIEFNKTWLNYDDKTAKLHYWFKSEIEAYLNNNQYYGKICFDYEGRPYKKTVDLNMSNLLHNHLYIVLKYKNSEKNLTLYPFTGAIK